MSELGAALATEFGVAWVGSVSNFHGVRKSIPIIVRVEVILNAVVIEVLDLVE